VAAVGHATVRTWVAIVAGVAIAVVCYRLAVLATDEWAAAVRALVDHGRRGVAAAFGLSIPSDLNGERLMWRAVNTLVRRPYTYSESKDVAGILKRFSVREPAEPKPTAASTPPALPSLLQDAWRAGSAIVIVQHPTPTTRARSPPTRRRPRRADRLGRPCRQAPMVTTSRVTSMASSRADRAGVAARSSSRRRRALRASTRVRASQGTPNGASSRWKATPRQPP
jgi:hypothetical protein